MDREHMHVRRMRGRNELGRSATHPKPFWNPVAGHAPRPATEIQQFRTKETSFHLR